MWPFHGARGGTAYVRYAKAGGGGGSAKQCQVLAFLGTLGTAPPREAAIGLARPVGAVLLTRLSQTASSAGRLTPGRPTRDIARSSFCSWVREEKREEIKKRAEAPIKTRRGLPAFGNEGRNT